MTTTLIQIAEATAATNAANVDSICAAIIGSVALIVIGVVVVCLSKNS